MNSLIENRIEEVRKLCIKYHVRCLEIFGSAVSESRFDSESSDLDFLVEFLPLKPGRYADAYFGLLEALEKLYGCPVDLVMPRAIKNPYFRESIDRDKVVLYAA